MEAIFILLALSLFVLYIGLNKKDSTLLIFSGILLVLGGLEGSRDGLGNLINFVPVSMIFVFIGIYIIGRTGIELIASRKDGNKKTKKE